MDDEATCYGMEWGPSHKKWRSISCPCRLKMVAGFTTETRQHGEQSARRRGVTQSTSSADSADGSVAARRSWAALGLSSSRFASAAAAIYSVFRPNIGNTPSISRRGVLEAPLCLICIGYHWVSSDLSGKAEKRSNCEMRTNYCMN